MIDHILISVACFMWFLVGMGVAHLYYQPKVLAQKSAFNRYEEMSRGATQSVSKYK